MMGSMIFRALLAALATGWAASTANCTNTEPVLGEVVTCPAVGKCAEFVAAEVLLQLATFQTVPCTSFHVQLSAPPFTFV